MKPKQERPGPDIGVPKRQHQVVAMLYLITTSQNLRESQSFLLALEAAVQLEWGWDPGRLKAELNNAERILIEYQGRTTFWFTKEGLEFDYNCTPPKE
jgi:hypothetical protein